jgi:hypothetical protein
MMGFLKYALLENYETAAHHLQPTPGQDTNLEQRVKELRFAMYGSSASTELGCVIIGTPSLTGVIAFTPAQEPSQRQGPSRRRKRWIFIGLVQRLLSELWHFPRTAVVFYASG